MSAEQAMFGLIRIWWETNQWAQHLAKALMLLLVFGGEAVLIITAPSVWRK